ncbi:MAG: SusE domain-containing protein [Prevotella sp.]|nr:SusE domain-containing protein [Prevotella sp.]
MKHNKIFSLLAAGMALLGMTSCSDDNDSNPVLNTAPTTFVLNTPTMSEQYIELTEDNTVSLSWSQPDYGFAALATYYIQVGVVGNGGNITWSDNLLETTYTKCRADVPGEEIAMAINDADGFKAEEDYQDMGVRPIAVRVISAILDGENNDIPITKITSNTVTFKQVQAYKAIKAPKKIWIIGACGGWTEPAEGSRDALVDWIVNETGVGTGIYQGTYDIPAGNFQLRFYSALTGWDGGASIGSQEADSSKEITMDGGVYDGDITAPGKGSWQISDWAGGQVRITVNMNTNKVKFEKL